MAGELPGFNSVEAVQGIFARHKNLQERQEELAHERREVDKKIEDLYLEATRHTRNNPSQSQRLFPSSFMIREVPQEEYLEFRSKANVQQESAIGRAIERTPSENRIGSQEDDTNRFGKSVREARRRAGLRQKDVAEKVGIDHTSISKIEAGIYTPTRAVTIKFADELGINDKVERIVFLLSANVGSLDDIKGFRLVPDPTPSQQEEAPSYKPLRPSPRWRGPTM